MHINDAPVGNTAVEPESTGIVPAPGGAAMPLGNFSILGSFISGTLTGQHIEMDGKDGTLDFYDADGDRAASMYGDFNSTQSALSFSDSDGIRIMRFVVASDDPTTMTDGALVLGSASHPEASVFLYSNNTNDSGVFGWTTNPEDISGAWGFTSPLANFVGLSASLVPAGDNTYNLGNNSFRWKLIRGVTITPGDLLMENGWVLTEHDKVGIQTSGLALKTPGGKMVMFFAEDGLYTDLPIKPLNQLI